MHLKSCLYIKGSKTQPTPNNSYFLVVFQNIFFLSLYFYLFYNFFCLEYRFSNEEYSIKIKIRKCPLIILTTNYIIKLNH